MTRYNSSGDVYRKFCRYCRSNIKWSYSERVSTYVAIALTVLNEQKIIGDIKVLHHSSCASWFDNTCVVE